MKLYDYVCRGCGKELHLTWFHTIPDEHYKDRILTINGFTYTHKEAEFCGFYMQYDMKINESEKAR